MMTESDDTWVKIANYRAGYEADIAIAVLDAAGIPAMRRGNDIVGLFGPGFEGPTARGVDVFVPAAAVADAQEVLSASYEDDASDELD
jgi:hypothetical protein